MSESRDKSRKQLIHTACGGVFLIGLALLFYFNVFWPWILALIGVIIIVEAITNVVLS